MLNLDSFNASQRAAVVAPLCPIRVLAGAGSGKTRVLIGRIAHLIGKEERAHQMLAVTFTNKATAEMQHRLNQLVGDAAQGLWLGTFHGLAHRILRRHAAVVGLPDRFTVLDESDQQRLVKQLFKELHFDEEKWPVRTATTWLNSLKDEGIRLREPSFDAKDPFSPQQIKLYTAYEERCTQQGLVDFGELLMKAADLWRISPELREQYRRRFTHIFVDEFQDTNAVQYRWLLDLTQGQGHVFVVGDDDQAIYGWRGADIRFIRRFSDDFPNSLTVKLEQNYRSTGHILAAANGVIAQNPARLGKNLFTDQGVGTPVVVMGCKDDREEAQVTVEAIQRFLAQGHASHEAAVLFRTNSQSRVIEEALIAARLPYQMRGGLRFLDRAEVKSVMAYLQLIVNRDSDLAFSRVVNLPVRGIGDKTLAALQTVAIEQQTSFWRTAQQFVQQRLPSPRAAKGLQQFLELIAQLEHSIQGMNLADQVVKATADSGLWAYFAEEERRDNLKELFRAAQQFVVSSEEDRPALTAFVEQAALGSGDGAAADEAGVQLMTLHGAKGLEFPFVAVVGWEEGLFPTARALSEPTALEEERRLAYVGITRAQRQLQLSFAARRLRFGEWIANEPSRFLQELPTASVEWRGLPPPWQSSARRSLSALGATPSRSMPSSTTWREPRESSKATTQSGGGSLVQRMKNRQPIQTVKPKPSAAQAEPSKSPRPGLRVAVSPPTDEVLAAAAVQVGRAVRHPQYGLGVVRQLDGEGDRRRAEVEFAIGNKWLTLAFANLTAG